MKLGSAMEDAVAVAVAVAVAADDTDSVSNREGADGGGGGSRSWSKPGESSARGGSPSGSGSAAASRAPATSREEEASLPWSDERESLFLTCHSSRRPASGNDRLRVLLGRAGKDTANPLDLAPSEAKGTPETDGADGRARRGRFYWSAVHSSPRSVCVLLEMKPSYAEAIAGDDGRAGARYGVDSDDGADDGAGNADAEDFVYDVVTIVPWIDVMKIGPDLFDHLAAPREGASSKGDEGEGERKREGEGEDGEGGEELVPNRGLRNFRGGVGGDGDGDGEGIADRNEVEKDEVDRPPSEEEGRGSGSRLRRKAVVFEMIPSADGIEDADADDVVSDLIAMAENGRRRRKRRRRMATMEEEEDGDDNGEDGDEGTRIGSEPMRNLSIQEALSVARAGRPGASEEEGEGPGARAGAGAQSKSEWDAAEPGQLGRWSTILGRGLESDDRTACLSYLERIVLVPSSLPHSYEFSLAFPSDDSDDNSNATDSESVAHEVPGPDCVASIVAGLSLHRSVVHVGILSDAVELHNAGARWVVQGAVEDERIEAGDGDDGGRRRRSPFLDAGLDGSGQIVSVSDTGLDVTNCYFKDESGNGSIFEGWDYSRRKVVKYDVSDRGGDAEDVQRGHGTHVSGTAVGRHCRRDEGEGDPDRKEGIAPGAKLHFYDIGDGRVVTDPRKSWFKSFHRSHPRRGAKIAVGSWGFGRRDGYDWVCRLYDGLVANRPDVLYVASAGNTGDKFDSPVGTLGAPASCKNVLAVGATNSADYGLGLGYVVDFSSRGPSSDGRTKPDLLAPGYALDSALSGSSADCSVPEGSYAKAGTSMSAPVVAGTAALIRQYFQEGWYPCGAPGCGTSLDPSGALLRAVLANGATHTKGVQVGGTDELVEDQPVRKHDDNQGHGEVNLLRSLPLQDENDFGAFVADEVALGDGESKTWYLDLDQEGCSSSLSATLAWNDPPSQANGCTRCLVNDLDLLVENLSRSKTHYPNGRDDPDRTNNIERVRIMDPRAGERYKLTAKAALGPGQASQTFALIITGCFQEVTDALPSSPVVTTEEHELPMTYSADRKQAGNMFSLKSKADGVWITGFAIHTLLETPAQMHVYKLNSVGVGINGNESFLNNPSAWTMITPSPGVTVDGMGFGSPTIIPEGSFDPVHVAKGATQSFYVTFVDQSEMLFKTTDSEYPTGAVYSSDSNIEITTGVGKGTNFGMTWQSRQMNGAVFYSVTSTGDSSYSSSDPTKRPTSIPTKEPTKQPTPAIPLYTELEATYSANKKQAGNMFDLHCKSSSSVVITSFKIHTLLTTSAPVTVYTREEGSYEGYDQNPSAWQRLGTVTANCKGYGNPTDVSGFQHVTIDAGTTIAFYITLESESPELLYYNSDDQPSGKAYSEDASLRIRTGVGKKGLFGETYLDRQLNGAVVYYLRS
ncbi:hypothetical protein ACHAWF_009425 [Thalassiosira exigua]